MKQLNNETIGSTRFESLYPENSREKEISRILDYVRSGLSCQVIGLPGVGRSNLLGLLAFNHKVRFKHLGEAQKNFQFIYLNFAELQNATIFEVNKFIFLHLIESLEERSYQKALEKTQALFKEALSFNEPLLLWQNLKKAVDFLANQEGLNLVLLFDRFEDYQKSVSSEFFLNLRTLRSLAKYRFAAVFTLSRPLEKSLESTVYKEFYEFIVGHHIFLPLLDKPGLEFRLSHLEKTCGKKLTAKDKENLLFLTGGHGKLTKVSAETILSSLHPSSGAISTREPQNATHLEEFLLLQADVRGALFEIWQSLTFTENDLLERITRLADGRVRQEKVEENETLEFFLNLNLVKKTKDGFSLTIPLLSGYLKTRRPKEEKIYFRVETNEILKGEGVISDGLTAQEFRLLKFLLENAGRVCEREEIIQVVWPEAKNLAGVSDEAIDQMVFRLRKKTEEDPKNPAHLQTLKGRGFRFLP